MHARSLHAYLKSANELARLSSHAERLLMLQRVFERIAPQPLARGGQVANYKLGMLVIHAANGAVAAKLRQLEPTLRDEFCKRCLEVTEIRVKVQAWTSLPSPAPAKHAALSPAAIQSLERLSGQLQESPLKQALEGMLKRQR